MSNKKKILLGVAFTLDAALTIALFVISIIMLVTMPKTQTDFIIAQQTPGLIPYSFNYLFSFLCIAFGHFVSC